MRRSPEFHFVADDSIQHSAQIAQTLHRLAEEETGGAACVVPAEAILRALLVPCTAVPSKFTAATAQHLWCGETVR